MENKKQLFLALFMMILLPTSPLFAGPTDISIDLFAVSGDEPISGVTDLIACLSSSATTRSCLIEEEQTCDFEVGVCHTTVDISTLSLDGTSTLALWLTVDGDDLDPVTLSAVPWAQYCSVAGSVSDGIIVTADLASNAITSAKTADDTFDLDKFDDTLDLDASTTFVADGSEVLTVTNGGTGNSFVVNDVTSDTTPFTIDTSGNVGIGDSSPDSNLDIFAASGSDAAMTMSDGDVGHSITNPFSSALTDAHLIITSGHSTSGGTTMTGISDTAGITGLELHGIISSADPTDNIPALELAGKKYDGASSTAALGDDETVLQVLNNTIELTTIFGDSSIFLSDDGVSHGMTGVTKGNGDVFGGLAPASTTAGGLIVSGSSDTDAMGLILNGAIGSADPTDTFPAVRISGRKYDGATNVTTLGAAETVMQVANNTTALMTVLGDGSVGIGDTTPEATLDIAVAIGSDADITLSDADVVHGMTGIAGTNIGTDTFGTLFRKHATSGGMVVMGIAEDSGTSGGADETRGIELKGALAETDPDDEVPAVAIWGFKSDGGTGAAALGALETVFQVQNLGTTLMKILGGSNGSGSMIVSPPLTEEIASGGTITANACGTIKPINSTGSVTTATDNTFTAMNTAALDAKFNGCCMTVVNVDTADTITLDDNAEFKTLNTVANIALAPDDSVQVCYSAGLSAWFQAGAHIAND